MKTTRPLFVAVGLIFAVSIACGNQPAHCALFVVNDQRDRSDHDLTDNKCDCDEFTEDDQCTLRAAIMQANYDLNEDQITFSVPSVSPTFPLPEITNPVNILGRYSDKAVVLDGSTNNISGPGLHISAGNSSVQDLTIIGFDSGFEASAIKLSGPVGANNIEKCFIGTDEAGTSGKGNGIGILVYNSDNTIGGSQLTRNVISGNDSEGILIQGLDAHDNLILGNYIGTNPAGTAALGNGGAGVLIDDDANANDVGGTNGVDSRNLISGNDIGIHVRQSENNKIQGNYIGTDVNGTIGLGNTRDGVIIGGSQNNTIGGTDPLAGNVISNNGEKGITILGNGSTGNRVEGNFIGTDVNGTAVLGNEQDGVSIEYAPNNTIGGSVAARNVISGNNRDGVVIQGANEPGYYASNTIVSANYIGTCVNGQTDLGNLQYGVRINGARQVTIGGLVGEDSRNIISGNDEDGIRIESSTLSIAKMNDVQGNYIGTNVSGEEALPNGMSGIHMEDAHENTIGGSEAARNVISGNDLNGIKIYGIFGESEAGNRIEWNYIGTDADGTDAVGNGEDGINIYNSANNIIGDSIEGSWNLISGNLGDGIEMIGSDSNGNKVQGNYIGTDKDGATALGNHANGVTISFCPGNIIGGLTAGSGNLISGNFTNGVEIWGSNATGNEVQRNLIGTDRYGTADLGNSNHGVSISASDNILGGTGPESSNVIAFNDDDGVHVSSGTGNSILGNSLFSNGDLGIDLGLDGVTANDTDDLDLGANDQQNFPELNVVGGFVVASLNSTPDKAFRLEFFSNTSCDPSGHGEGGQFLESFDVITDAEGNATIGTALSGSFITATATEPDGSTSEFSACASTPVYLDYGDAPSPYPTLTADNGAYHVIANSLYLGDGVDADPDGQPGVTALGDDNDGNDDEDGVVFMSAIAPGATADVTVESSGSGMLNAWLDFNLDGDWGDVGEQIFTNESLSAGINAISFTVPGGSSIGVSFARFRFSTQGNLDFLGSAPDGEVEDHPLVITDPDTDEDGMPDSWEVEYSLNRLVDDAREDADEDGYSNLREYLSGTSPRDFEDVPPIISDADTDDDSDGRDLSSFAEEFNNEDCLSETCVFDLDLDGDVDEIDLMLFSEDFGHTVAP